MREILHILKAFFTFQGWRPFSWFLAVLLVMVTVVAGLLTELGESPFFWAASISVGGVVIFLGNLGRSLPRGIRMVLDVTSLLSVLLAPLLGLPVLVTLFFSARSIWGDLVNPPWSHCEVTRNVEDLEKNVRRGMDVNGRCCVERMIGDCAVVISEKMDETHFSFSVQGDDAALVRRFVELGGNVSQPDVLRKALRFPSNIEAILAGKPSVSAARTALGAVSVATPERSRRLLEEYLASQEERGTR